MIYRYSALILGISGGLKFGGVGAIGGMVLGPAVVAVWVWRKFLSWFFRRLAHFVWHGNLDRWGEPKP